MGVSTSEVGYTPAMPRREGHEVYKGHVVALDKKKISAVTSNYKILLAKCTLHMIHCSVSSDRR